MLRMDIALEGLPLTAPFHISGFTFTEVPIVVVRLRDGDLEGRGEAAGVYYHDDTPAGAVARLEAVRGQIEAGVTREALRELLPAGGARNAVDCALWELESLKAGAPVWRLAGLEPPRPLLTTFTLGANPPEAMGQGALGFPDARALKLKLTGEAELDVARVRAVRAARPGVWIGVDANRGYTRETLPVLLPALHECEVSLLEQPFQLGCDNDLEGLDCGLPLAADESVQGLADVERLAGLYDVINIKLDKCGGLTEGLMMANEARRLGMKVMVGNMVGTSWAMAPAFVLGQMCDVVDLDGPIYLAADRQPSIRYEGGNIVCPEAVWGYAEAGGQAQAG